MVLPIPHSTLATHELSSFCSHPPSPANHRPSNAHAVLHSSLRRPSLFITEPVTLQSAVHHSHHPFRRTDNLPSSSYSSSNWANTATPDVLLVELHLPSAKLLILHLSVEQQPATVSSSITTPTDLDPIPLPIFDPRQATARSTA
jgi:hypothetical protein